MLILYYEEIREREIILFSFLLILGGKSMSIQVKSLGLVKNEEIEIKAIASLEVEGMRIDGIRVNESENGNLYLQFPERKFKKRSTDELITTRLMFADNDVFKKISDTLIKRKKKKANLKLLI